MRELAVAADADQVVDARTALELLPLLSAFGYTFAAQSPTLNPDPDEELTLTMAHRIVVIARDDGESIDAYGDERASA